MGLAILTLAMTIGFFGSSSVLMPSQQAATGMFSGELTVQNPLLDSINVRDVRLEESRLSFILDSEVTNPNVVESRLKKVSYEIKVDGETVKRGIKDGSTTIPADDSRMIALSFDLDFSGVPDTKRVLSQFEEDKRQVTVEGAMDFDVAGSTVSVPFLKRAQLN